MTIKRIIGLLIGVLLLYLSLKGTGFHKILAIVSDTNGLFIVMSCAFFLLDSFFKWYKWAYIVRVIDYRVVKSDTFSPFVVGLGCNNLVPFKLGEILKMFLLHSKTGLSNAKIMLSIYTEKLYEGTALLILFFLSLEFVFVSEWIKELSFILLIFFILILIGTFLIIKYNTDISRFVKMRRISGFIASFSDHSNLLTDFHKILYISALSFLMWCSEAQIVWSLSKAFSFELSYINCIFIAAVFNFGIFIPTSPGSIGTFEFLIIKSLATFHIAKADALAFALVLHTILFVPFVLIGIILFVQEGMLLKDIFRLYKKDG